MKRGLACAWTCVILAGCAGGPGAGSQSNAPSFQLYEGPRRAPAEVAILRARGSQTHVEKVSGEGIIWTGATLAYGNIGYGVQGPQLGRHVESLELVPGEYRIDVLFFQHGQWSTSRRQATFKALPGRSYFVEAKRGGQGFEAVVTDAATGEPVRR